MEQKPQQVPLLSPTSPLLSEIGITWGQAPLPAALPAQPRTLPLSKHQGVKQPPPRLYNKSNFVIPLV